eukprot:TCONS_00070647-protein
MQLLPILTFTIICTFNQLSTAFKHNVGNPDFLPFFPFFPYGKGFDYVLTDPPNYVFAEGDEDYGIFDHYLSKELPIFQNPNTRWIFVGVNGYVSFTEPWYSNGADKFPQAGPGISLFQTDLVFTDAKDSHLSFKEYDEEDKDIMEHARNELEVYANLKDFDPNHVIVVTWHKASKKDNKGNVTFQLVLASDGFNTYAILNYEDITISLQRKDFCPVTIGWQEDLQRYVEHENMQLTQAFPYRPIRMSKKSNIGFPGKWIYKLFGTKIAEENKPSPVPTRPANIKHLPAECPGNDFCQNTKNVLNVWPGYSTFYVVCPPGGAPVCMPCAEGTAFSPECRTCVHTSQLGQPKDKLCPQPSKKMEDRVKQTARCNHADALRHCTMRENQLHDGQKKTQHTTSYRNHNDVNGASYYLCAGAVGSFCMPCPAGTVFQQYEHDKNNGACVHKSPKTHAEWI